MKPLQALAKRARAASRRRAKFIRTCCSSASRSAAGRFGLLVTFVCVFACVELTGPEAPPPDPRMLRGTIGPGAERLVYELERDRSVIDAFAANGPPDYVWAPSPSQLVLLFLSADK